MALFAAPAPRADQPARRRRAGLRDRREFFTLGLTAIPAVMLGHVARGQIRRTGEAGDGLALTGLILGWIGVTLWVLFWWSRCGRGHGRRARRADARHAVRGRTSSFRHAVPG